MNIDQLTQLGIGGVAIGGIVIIVKEFLKSSRQKDEVFTAFIRQQETNFTKIVTNHISHSNKAMTDLEKSNNKVTTMIEKLIVFLTKKI